MTLRSGQFDDIYFSVEDGLSETRHVFLDHNNLPAAFAGRDWFTIAETGFGAGLNFLSVWKLFEETAAPGAVLDYVSFELYPLAAEEIMRALAHWSSGFGGRLEKMVASYPLRIPGWHRINFGRVRLTLVFDDVNAALPRVTVPRGVDAWFLDGFAPAKNPQMWTPTVFQNMARLSKPGTTLASFTAAGIVKNGLREAGFAIEKRKGYGRKRDMIAGRFEGENDCSPAPVRPKSVAVVGAGLAGAACAAMLRAQGMAHTVFDAGDEIASAASGNMRGLFNPRFTAERGAEADFYAAGFALAARTLRGLEGAEIVPCGSLHLITDEDKKKRFDACARNWGWPVEHMRLLDKDDASGIAGVSLNYGALYLPDSGSVSPRGICAALLEGSEIRLGHPAGVDELAEYDAVILACADGARNFLPDLPLHTVRGQVIVAEATPESAGLKSNLCYGGYIGASVDGRHVIGSTFQKWLTTTEPRAEDNAEIMARLHEHVPSLAPGKVVGARAALRCSARDRFPVIGAVEDRPSWYVSTGHGSHGIVSALTGAQLIGDLMCDGVWSLPDDSVKSLAPGRFAARLKAKGRAKAP